MPFLEAFSNYACFDLIPAENFPFLVHLYAWASPQARSLCICKQHEDAFVLQNWLSHGKIYSLGIKSFSKIVEDQKKTGFVDEILLIKPL